VIDLVIIAIFSAVLVPLVEFSSGALRISLGLVFVLFSPGYSLIAALFPKTSDISGIERVALSFGLSIAVVPLIGLALNYSPWGIRLYPILVSLLVFIVAMLTVAWYRRRQLVPEERFQFELQSRLQSVKHPWVGQGRWDRILTVLLILAILGAMGSLGYVIAKPKVGESFTQFYILGLEGKAEGYPREVTLGESASVTLGIANHEHQPTSYRVETIIDEEKVGILGPIALKHEEEWEESVSFSPIRAGPRQKVEFWLYKNEGEEVYLKTHLWVDVTAEGLTQ
jgi:uncharacterized membrane protein